MKSAEEVLAKKLDDLLADSRIEPYLVGRYFAQSATKDVYKNFEEMTSSAIEEKQNRLQWIKEIIIGEKEMKEDDDFDRKAQILQDALFHEGNETISEFFEQYEYLVTCWTAGAYVESMVDKLSDRATADIEAVYGALIEAFGITDDKDIYDISDILERAGE